MSTSTAAPSRPAGFDLGARARSLVRGRPSDPVWVRPTLLGVVLLAALLCVWDVTVSGYGNTYYAAAVKAGSESWKAWFFGSLDPGSFITVDKPPLSLWVLGLSSRVFGFSSLSLLLPQAVMTVASVGLLYATVRRVFGAGAGLLAAGALALMPVAVALGRFDDPDTLLVLLFVGAAYLMVRALESGRTKWLLWCGALVGLAFMTKMLQGWMIVPALFAAYLLAGPPRLAVRVRQLGLAGLVMVAVSAAWPVAVSLWPGSTPYIGGSTNGSVWDLIFGYNGFGRLFGESGPGGGARFGGSPGLLRIFNEQVGGQVAWLLPVAAAGLVAGLWLTRRAPRTDRVRAAWVLFGVWAVVHVAVFSAQQGIFHPYYVSALAPAVAALAGAGAVTLWRSSRTSLVALLALDLAVIATAALALVLLGRTPDFAPALRIVVPILAAMAVVGITWHRLDGSRSRRALAGFAAAAVVAALAGPAAYSLDTTSQALSGGNLTAGPASASFGGGSGAAGGRPPGAMAGGPPGGFAGTPPGGMGGGPGGESSTADAALVRYLTANQGSAKYLVAAMTSHTSAPIIIASGKPVVTIGGFSGTDPTPTVAQLSKLVQSGQLRYVLLGGGGGGPGGQGSAQAITAWVQQHGTAVTGVTTNGGTLYRVTA